MEYIDLYKDEYKELNITIPRHTPIPAKTYCIVVFMAIFNSKGDLLIQQRHPAKGGWGGLWDLTAGGAVQSGESSLEGVIRETAEEVGVTVTEDNLHKILTLYYEDSIHDFYTAIMDLDPGKLQIQAEEVAGVRWASEEEVMKMMDDGTFIPVYKDFIRLLFQMKIKRGIMLDI